MVRWVVAIGFPTSPAGSKLEESMVARTGKDGIVNKELCTTLIGPILDVADLLAPFWRNTIRFHDLDKDYHSNNCVNIAIGGSTRSYQRG